MKTFLTFGLMLALNGLLTPFSWAQSRDTALVPLPSVDDFTRGQDGWGFALGLGVEYESAYEGSDELGFEVQPAGGVQWRKGNDVVFWAGETLGWRGLRAQRWLLEAAVGFDEGRQEKDSKKGRLKGLGDTAEGSVVVLQSRYALDANWRYWLLGRVVSGRSGNLGLFGAGRRFGERSDGTGSEVNVVAVYHDGKVARRDFGISAQQSLASGLNPTPMGGGLRSFGVNYAYRYNIDKHWQIFGEALYERFSRKVQTSPIARSSFEGEVGVGLLYRF